MTKQEVLSETPISMADLKEDLKNIRKRDESLNFRAEQTEEYLAQFSTIKPKEAKDIFKAIDEIGVPRLKPEHIIKLVDVLPTTPDEVKMVLQGYTITVTKENMKKIADTIKEMTKDLAKAPKSEQQKGDAGKDTTEKGDVKTEAEE